MINFGIIGYGKMGATRHRAVLETGVGRVVRIAGFPGDPVEPGLAASRRELLEDPGIDAVFICAINALNKPLTIEALRAGKHVFCEKPPAFNAAEVEEIRAVEAEAGRVLMYGFNHRHHGSAVRMRDVVDSGEFGSILWMRGRYGKSVDENYFNTWRADRELAGGGILIDQGIHMVDLFLHLAGDFDSVQAVCSNLYWNLPGVEDNVFALLHNTQTGCVASLHSTMTQWRHLFSLEVFMQRGYMVLNGLKTSSGTYGSEQLVIARNRSEAPAATWRDEVTEVFDANESGEREARLFADWIRSGPRRGDWGGDSLSALRAMRMIDRIYACGHHAAPKLYSRLNAQDDL